MRTVEPRAPVMADVARLAGVSQQTVSRVVNGSPHLRPHTRLRVQQAIDQLGYRPNSAARALVRGRTGILGVISTGSVHFGPASIQRTVDEAARQAGLFASSLSMPELTRDLLDDAVEHLRHQRVEGIIIIAGQDEAVELARSPKVGVPIVVVEGDLSRAAWTVGVDQAAGARAATQHLLDLGHREIAHIAGPANWGEARARRDGWSDTLQAAGLRPLPPVHVDWTAAAGHQAGRVLAQRREITAIFAASDQIAIGLLRALDQAGRRVPADVSVVGFDDLPESTYLCPPLTTVRQDFAAVGRKAVEMMQVAISGAVPTPTELIAPELVVRASTGPAPGR